MNPRHLINSDGLPFESTELAILRTSLDTLPNADRESFRNNNATAIAQHPASNILVVSGPGTGKSTLFKQRISHWLTSDANGRVLALSFVKKLVADLAADIQTARDLSDEQKARVDVFTLHKYARSLVEKNHGTLEWRFSPHFQIISPRWQGVVWNDVLALVGIEDKDAYSWKIFEKQLYDDAFRSDLSWSEVVETYFVLCKFNNAAGFSDLVLRARDVAIENPELGEHDYFILDEYQDFNTAEERLLENLSQAALGKLTVGDDDQVLYEELRSGKASLIRTIYKDQSIANAMLPFCGRSDFHITKSAGHFIDAAGDTDSIEKLYLPISDDNTSAKVQIVACATPSTAVDYVRSFIEEHSAAIEERRVALKDGKAKDAYLLILSPSKAMKFYSESAKDLQDMVLRFQRESIGFCEDYYMLLSYFSLSNHPENNFNFRKVLHYEKIVPAEVLKMLNNCITHEVNFADLQNDITDAVIMKCSSIKEILESNKDVDVKLAEIASLIEVVDISALREDITRKPISQGQVQSVEHEEEEDAELEELEVKKMSAVEIMTIVGSKGLSADHVMLVGFDNVNMSRITINAFYVGMTRARKSLHLVTATKAGGATVPHHFIDMLPEDHIDYLKYTKGRKKELFVNKSSFLNYFRTLSAARRYIRPRPAR